MNGASDETAAARPLCGPYLVGMAPPICALGLLLAAAAVPAAGTVYYAAIRPAETGLPMAMAVFDTHFHIIDFRFPVSENQGFMPPSFTVADYRHRIEHLGIVGGAVVTGSFQNFDTGFMRDALAQLGPSFVGVVQIPADAPEAEILALDAIGVRGVRFNLVRGGSAGFQDLDRVARRVHELAGWHVELYADAKDLAPAFATLSRLPALSIAHLGLSTEGLPTLLRLVERGMKVKTTGFGRFDLDVPAAIRALASAHPDCLMFGSDLPSQRARRPFEPNDMSIIRASIDPTLERKVFYENAIGFYRPRSGAETVAR